MGIHQEWLAIKVLDTDGFGAGQRVTGRHRQDKGLAHQAFGGVAGFQQRRADDAQVDAPRAKGFVLLVGVHFRQDDFDLRLFQPCFGDDFRQKLVHRAADETDGDRADVALGKAPGGRGGLLRLLQQVLRFDEKSPAGGSEGNAAGAAGEQFDAQVMLQQLDLPAQGRLGHVQPFGGAAEIEFRRDGGKAAQLGEFKH
ncbi:hypothetical protein ALO79_200383 [Pseudomonas syringae pv. castaneae]|uniref:Type IV secretory pathway, VirJ component n=1 Tax=Pseudomonas syringae pv. castaneae TaxID=264450 RepID=A0A0P9S492_PSESX|nr:hypothetical protein ALO79_200383 [Pseudomonas syringae pv. castaneae]